MLHDIFISYAREDQAAVDEYFNFLTARGLDVWYDGLHAKDSPVFEQLEVALRRSTFVFLLWSRHSAQSDYVKKEVQLAAELGKKIVPIKLDNRGFTVGVRLILTGVAVLDGRKGVPEAGLAEMMSRLAPHEDEDAPTFLLLNMKGGVGKTTLAANIAGTFHAMGKSVLLIDLDAQANLSILLMNKSEHSEAVEDDRSIITCFENSVVTGAAKSPTKKLYAIDPNGNIPRPTQLAFSLRSPVVHKRLDLIVGQFELFKYSLWKNFDSLPACKVRFERFLAVARRQYEIVILDAAPSNSFITECAIEAASDIVAPATPDKYALTGIDAIFRLMDEGLGIAKPVHVVRNCVPAAVGTAEQAIANAYPTEIIGERIRDSAFFKVRNADPDARVRDPLGELAYMRGAKEIKESLVGLCEALLIRHQGNKKSGKTS